MQQNLQNQIYAEVLERLILHLRKPALDGINLLFPVLKSSIMVILYPASNKAKEAWLPI